MPELLIQLTDNYSFFSVITLFEISNPQRVLRPLHCSMQMALFPLIKMERWAELFTTVLNCPKSINDDAIDRLPQIECNILLDEISTVVETRKAVQQLPPDNAKGIDVIPSGVYMYNFGGSDMGEKLRETLHASLYVKKGYHTKL